MHHTVADDALREILIRCPDADLLHALAPGCKMRGGRERIVRFEFNHRPNHDAHRDDDRRTRPHIYYERAEEDSGPEPIAAEEESGERDASRRPHQCGESGNGIQLKAGSCREDV